MKSINFVFPMLIMLLFVTFDANAQRVVKTKPAHKVVVVKHRKTPPKKVVIYHPGWAPKKAFYRRWIYFLRYNFYWDNVRRVYIYRNGNVWVTSVGVPAFVVNVDLDKEKYVELPEGNDGDEEVYQKNEVHLKMNVDSL